MRQSFYYAVVIALGVANVALAGIAYQQRCSFVVTGLRRVIHRFTGH